MADIDVESVLAQLTPTEKVELLSGKDFWHTAAIKRLGIPALRLSDGPNGIRGTAFFNAIPAACVPCATGLGATFDGELLVALGQLIGQEAKAKGAHIWLGPTINIQRSPLGGRGFESFSEDPLLSGTLAGFYCQGVHKENIISTPKHFVCNDQEHERMAVNSILTQRALREIYLLPFMLAIKMSSPKALMTAYNKVNGIHVSEDQQILENILRKEWKWSGMVMSDWYGTYSTSKSILAGLDLEMPGPSRWRGTALAHAVLSRKIPDHVLDDRVRSVLTCIKEATKSGIPENAKEEALNRPEDQSLLRRAAAQSVVLLKNEGNILPLDKTKPIAVIGPNSKVPIVCGGGSASLTPYYAVSPFEGISNAAETTSVKWAQGCYGHQQLPLIGDQLKTKEGKRGFDVRFYLDPPGTIDRECVDRLHLTSSSMLLVDYQTPRITSNLYYVDCEGIFVPEVDGVYEFGVSVSGTAKLFIDHELIVDNATSQTPGPFYFGKGTIEEIGSKELKAGQEYTLSLEFGSMPTSPLTSGDSGSFGAGAVRFGCCRSMRLEESISEAVELARETEQVVVVVGLNGDWESEGYDREHMNLPYPTDELVYKVLAANPNAVIVNQSGTPVYMPWADDAKAILQAWYAGNETGNGLADVLYGDFNPSGKLPLTIPKRVEDNPAYLNFRTEGGRVLYGEDIYVGYRFYEKAKVPTRFPFGHGLSYTAFKFSDLKVSIDDSTVTVSLTTSNIGLTAGMETVQVYISQRSPSINRPLKELKGFQKVSLIAGESKEVAISMERKYVTSYWDEIRESWIEEKGDYELSVGNSSDEQSGVSFLKGYFSIEKTSWWNGL